MPDKLIGGPAAVAGIRAVEQQLARQLHPSLLVVMIARNRASTNQTVDTVTAISLGGAIIVIVVATLLALLVVFGRDAGGCGPYEPPCR